MKTIEVELKHSKALIILRNLEDADIIRLIKSSDKKKTTLSKSLRGSLSKKKSRELHGQLSNMRAEWSRNTW